MALASRPVMAQTGGADVVVMSVRTVGAGRVRVVIAYADGKTQEQFIETMGESDKQQDRGTSDYQRVLTTLYQQGYSLKSTFSQDAGRFTTLIFLKEK